MRSTSSPTAARSGFTVLELAMVMSIFAVIGYAIVGAVDMGNRSSRQVLTQAAANADLRESALWLSDELSMAQAAGIVVTDLPDGNQQLDFQAPIRVGNVLTWGVDEPRLGVNPDWWLRYTVLAVNGGQGVQRQLVRQVVDDLGQVRQTRVVASGLTDEPGEQGFSCALVGNVWVIGISTAQGTHGGERETEFHVRVRN